MQGWISKVTELHKRRALPGGRGEIHDQGVMGNGMSLSDAEPANDKPAAEEYEACGSHVVYLR